MSELKTARFWVSIWAMSIGAALILFEKSMEFGALLIAAALSGYGLALRAAKKAP
jgi:hypothetical protein